MQKDFHYYATYCAARIAGYPHEEGLEICYSAQLVDWCSRTFLSKLKGPGAAATTQLQLELMEARTDPVGLQDITRIWSSFHFLPYDLQADPGRASRQYRNKYRLICKPNGALLAKTVELAKKRGTQAVGIAMHVLADTWAHSYFAGTPSLVINNTDSYFYELREDQGRKTWQPIQFRHSPGAPDDLDQGLYSNSIYQWSENSIMNLGHGRAGHLPDYSFMRYKYLPAWGDYTEMLKDNPSDYYKAFCQMVHAMRYLRGDIPAFTLNTYDTEAVAPWAEEIHRILVRRQLDACDDWKALAERIAGQEVPDFDLEKYQDEYLAAEKAEKDGTFLGQFFIAALAQKSMVTNAIFRSGSLLAGFSVELAEKGFRGIRDFRKLMDQRKEEQP
ncbi:MAG: hypothetical protein J5927_02335 [Oscillospiraceae bacterium]|nr:hypothetical protein [Oscillospiraceae bacterium]